MKESFLHTIREQFSNYRRSAFFRKLATVMGGDILARISGFILIPLYLRLMTQEEYGLYNYFASIIQTLGLVLTLGLYIPQIKLYHSLKSTGERGSMLFTVSSTLVGFILFLLVPVFLFGLDYQLADLFFANPIAYGRYRLLLLLALSVTILGFILTYYLFAAEKIRAIKMYNYFRIFFTVLTALSLFIFHDDTVWYRLLFTYIAEFLLIMYFSRHLIAEIRPVFSGRMLNKSLSIGLPIMCTTVFTLIVSFSDKFYLEKNGDLSALSGYYLAFTFAAILSLIAASLQNVWMPLFMKEENLQKNSEKTKKLLTRLVLGFILLGCAIWLLFEVLLQLSIIPAEYRDASLVLPVLILSQIFMAVTSILNNYLIYFEKTWLLLFAGLAVSILSIVSCRYLVPAYGMFGAAYSVLVSSLVYLGICFYLVRLFKNRHSGRELAVQAI